MGDKWEIASYWVTVDTMIADKAFLLSGFVVTASVDGGVATLYDQQSPETPSSLGAYTALANSPTVVMFPKPIRLSRGLYVDVGTSCAGVLVIGSPIPSAKA